MLIKSFCNPYIFHRYKWYFAFRYEIKHDINFPFLHLSNAKVNIPSPHKFAHFIFFALLSGVLQRGSFYLLVVYQKRQTLLWILRCVKVPIKTDLNYQQFENVITQGLQRPTKTPLLSEQLKNHDQVIIILLHCN